MKIIKVKISLLLSLLIIAPSLFALDAGTISTTEKSVVLVSQQVFFDKNKTSEPTLWEKLEQSLDEKILDTFITTSSGSGFFIDASGHLLTNAHVVAQSDPQTQMKN